MGLPFDPVTHGDVIARVDAGLTEGEGGWIVTPNLDIVRQAVQDVGCRRLIEAADLVLGDGMPIVWASRLQGTPLPQRVAGSDLVWSLPELAARRGESVFLLGGEPGTAEQAAAQLLDRIPGLRVAATSPPMSFDPEDEEAVATLARELVESNPGIVFVALGFPKQERLIKELQSACPQAWFIGIGIALAYVAGTVKRAPRWVRILGLEWVFRLLQEPRRLAHRYLIDGLPFAGRLLATSWRHRSLESR